MFDKLAKYSEQATLPDLEIYKLYNLFGIWDPRF